MAKAKLSTRLIAYVALMTALTYVGTLLGFSGAQFYFNLGDSVILVCAYLLGPIPAMIAGGLGSFLGDLTVYPATMLYTLFIKAIEGLAAGLLFMLLKKLCARYFANRLSGEMRSYMQQTPPAHAGSSSQKPQADSSSAPSAPAAPYAPEAAADICPRPSAPDAENAPTPDQADDKSHNNDFAYADETVQKNDIVSAQATDQGNSSDAMPLYDGIAATDGITPDQADDRPDSSASASAKETALKNGENEKSIPKNAANENISILKKRKIVIQTLLSLPICLFSSGLMAVGYFICQTFMYGTYASAILALPLDAVQAAISSAAATAVIALLSSKSR